MRILVLGATGYLGTKLLERLMEKEENQVACLVRETVGKEWYDRYKEKIEIVVGDINVLHSFLIQKKIDWLINCVSVYENREHSREKIIDSNLVFALKSLDLATKYNIENYLYINTALHKYMNLYSCTKRTFSEFGYLYSQKYGINFIDVVLEMYYGKNEPEERFIPSCISKMRKNEELFLTQGTQKRDIIYIDDVVEAIIIIIHTKLLGYRQVPLGTGEGPSIKEILMFIHKQLNSESILHFGAIPMREDEEDSVADMRCINELGYMIRYSWKDGLKELLK